MNYSFSAVFPVFQLFLVTQSTFPKLINFPSFGHFGFSVFNEAKLMESVGNRNGKVFFLVFFSDFVSNFFLSLFAASQTSYYCKKSVLSNLNSSFILCVLSPVKSRTIEFQSIHILLCKTMNAKQNCEKSSLLFFTVCLHYAFENAFASLRLHSLHILTYEILFVFSNSQHLKLTKIVRTSKTGSHGMYLKITEKFSAKRATFTFKVN